ncbi:hypothetical protein BsWGS_01870 [Bradybaena similaris]
MPVNSTKPDPKTLSDRRTTTTIGIEAFQEYGEWPVLSPHLMSNFGPLGCHGGSSSNQSCHHSLSSATHYILSPLLCYHSRILSAFPLLCPHQHTLPPVSFNVIIPGFSLPFLFSVLINTHYLLSPLMLSFQDSLCLSSSLSSSTHTTSCLL